MTSSPGTEVQARAVRTLARTFLTLPLVLLVPVLLALPLDDAREPPLALTLGVLALVGAGFAAAHVVGYRAPAIEPGTSAEQAGRESLQRFQTMLVLRFAMTEAPLLVALALSFALDHGPWPYLVAVVPGALSLAFHTWPGRRTVGRTRAALESRGARSYLDEALAA